jgi:hypothetical protein
VLGPAPFNTASYEDIPPSAEDIADGLRDTLRGNPATEQAGQTAIRAADPVGMWRAAASRFAPSFLNGHPEFVA